MRSRMAREARRSGDGGITVAVISGKGGVGKTNLAVNLALSAQGRGVATVLVDLDLGLANADVLLGVQPECDLRDVLAHRRELADALLPTEGGVLFAAAALGAAGRASDDIERARLRELIERMPGELRLLDCAAGVDANVMAFARMADVALVVTTPEPTAITDAYAAIKTLFRESYDGSVRVLVNMVETRPEARAVFQRLSQACENFLNFPIADAGYVLHDTHVELAVRQRRPFVERYPRSSASLCVSAVAARLVGGRAARPGAVGLLRRAIGMFA